MSEVVYKPSEKLATIYTGGTLAPPKFMPTLYEWLKSRGQEILKMQSASSVAGSSASNTLYEVPENKIFFLTGCSIALSRWTGSIGITIADIKVNRTAYPSLLVISSTELDSAQNEVCNSTQLSQSFNPPLCFRSGEKILIEEDNGGETYGTLVGFLVNVNDVPQV